MHSLSLYYKFGWDWTGFNGGYSKVTITNTPQGTTTLTEKPPGRTLWDLLQLLIVPIMLAIGGFWLNQIQKSREEKTAKQRAEDEQKIATDNQREAALQAYIDKLSELLLKGHLSELKPEYEEVRKIARVRTLTVLHRLDGARKGSVLQFLHEAGLLDKDKPIVDLDGANLNETNLSEVNLSKANLRGVDLKGANLWRANLWRVDLSKANLNEADFRGAYLGEANLSITTLIGADLGHANLTGANLQDTTLTGANLQVADLSEVNLSIATLTNAILTDAILSGANLRGAKVAQEQLEKASSLAEATMPNGSKHP